MEDIASISPQLRNILINVGAGLIVIYPLWRIFRRAGFYPILSVLVFVPMVGPLIVAIILGFSRWPTEPRSKRGWTK